MVVKTLTPLPTDEKESCHEHEEHVLITEYLISANKAPNEIREDEHSIIAVSPNDHRWYRLIELRNGLRCMLITNNSHGDSDDEDDVDADADDSGGISSQDDTQSNAIELNHPFTRHHMTTLALYFPAGSLLDSSDSQGLAHLTEHLLFSSSSKYPEINCLDTFVSYHGGTIHAYTELEFTVIIIEIISNRIVEALDILVHSLIDPLMLSETIDAQIQVINDECSIVQFDDHYRASRLLAHFAEESHPISNFSWGNRTSLKEFNETANKSLILKQLIKDRYCIPEGMNLVMISDESLRVMQQYVERLFCLMKRSFRTLPDYVGFKQPWNTDEFKKFHLVYPSEDIHQLRISFPLPSFYEYWRIKPGDYIRFIFSHEAPGSLNSYLKNKLWTTNIDFEIGDSQLYHNSCSSLFTLILDLTRQGLKNLRSIIDTVFEAINLLKRLGPLKRVYDDIQLTDLHGFLFQEKMDTITYADTIVRNLRKYPSLYVLFGHNLHLQFEPVACEISIFNTILELDPRKCNMMLLSKACLSFCNRIEPWFQIKYGQFDIPNDWISYWLNPNINAELSIPDSSQYLAVDFSIKPFDLPLSEAPIMLLEEDFGTLWYFRNQETIPKAFFYLHFLSPYVNLTPQHSCLFDLYALILNALLRAHAYPGKASHISIHLVSTDTGLILKLTGFNQHLSKYLETILQLMYTFQISEENTSAWKQELKDEYMKELMNSKRLLKHVRMYLMKHSWWPVFEKLQFLNSITHKQIIDFSILFRSNLTMNILVSGNITAKESKELFYLTQNVLELGAVPKILIPSLRAIQLPAQQSIVKVESYQPNDCATHILICFEHGITSIRDYTLIEIVAEIMQDSLEDYLQTAGTNHFTSNVTLRDTYGVVSLQIELSFSSELYNSLDVVDFVSKFFIHFKDLMVDMTSMEFERLISIFRNAKQNIDNSLKVHVDRYWTEIILNSFVFDRYNQERHAREALTVTDIQQWYNQHILGSNHRQLIIILCSQEEHRRTTKGIIVNKQTPSVTPESQRNQYNTRPNMGVPIERLPKIARRHDASDDDDSEHASLLQSRTETKMRCLTTKHKHNIELGSTKNEALQLKRPLEYPNDVVELEYIFKLFESIEVNNGDNVYEYDKPLKLLFDTDSYGSKTSLVYIDNLKKFKEACLLYNVACIK